MSVVFCLPHCHDRTHAALTQVEREESNAKNRVEVDQNACGGWLDMTAHRQQICCKMRRRCRDSGVAYEKVASRRCDPGALCDLLFEYGVGDNKITSPSFGR